MDYKLGQAFVTNWGSFVLLQITANVVTNRDSFSVTNWVSTVKNWGNCYKLSKCYYKIGQLFQIGAGNTN